MPKVTCKGEVLAASDNTVIIEGNHYFPPSSLNEGYFSDSETHTVCPWKGNASYYDATVGGETVRDIAWYYPKASEKAKAIEGYVAFYKNKVTIVVDDETKSAKSVI